VEAAPPLAAQFMQPDPIMQAPYFSQGLNPYAYVFNDPVNHTDPSGFTVADMPGGWGIVVSPDEVSALGSSEGSAALGSAGTGISAGTVASVAGGVAGGVNVVNDVIDLASSAKWEVAPAKFTATPSAQRHRAQGATQPGPDAASANKGGGTNAIANPKKLLLERWGPQAAQLFQRNAHWWWRQMQRDARYLQYWGNQWFQYMQRLWPNLRGMPYPKVIDPRTGRFVPFPSQLTDRIPKHLRVPDGGYRDAFIKEWRSRGYAEPSGGWSKYEIHHILPREFGGNHDFWNMVPLRKEVHQEFTRYWSGF
jgi:hypothetical protein